MSFSLRLLDLLPCAPIVSNITLPGTLVFLILWLLSWALEAHGMMDYYSEFKSHPLHEEKENIHFIIIIVIVVVIIIIFITCSNIK